LAKTKNPFFSSFKTVCVGISSAGLSVVEGGSGGCMTRRRSGLPVRRVPPPRAPACLRFRRAPVTLVCVCLLLCVCSRDGMPSPMDYYAHELHHDPTLSSSMQGTGDNLNDVMALQNMLQAVRLAPRAPAALPRACVRWNERASCSDADCGRGAMPALTVLRMG